MYTLGFGLLLFFGLCALIIFLIVVGFFVVDLAEKLNDALCGLTHVWFPIRIYLTGCALGFINLALAVLAIDNPDAMDKLAQLDISVYALLPWIVLNAVLWVLFGSGQSVKSRVKRWRSSLATQSNED